ncbi:hypothetical protein GUITHDRAFT_76731 [Guillardia theta CCMP2712]|uniref:non-specific serine/threonine protein kinase n=1 Tax=Guillardia theta (strain CCMP2712) TaxID=905079 RepID=L1IT05_GUITC|nr:hypothetical protein GUITHDRAFT_76731 [Guillardia theta CCMP2712]EKX38970.1 hypothetical protein GUITHDRAFT_76731 [Guillardia theta CCMP2712]|eukprot:XP_005825950.1 hypothetical protein GUITHDRAFT_76731 [Guillardia theta CCMP2712]
MDAHRGHRDDGRQASRRSSNPWQSLSHRDFYIEKEIARTNAGSVFKAKHHRTGLLVVLKSRRSAEIGKDGNIMHEVEILQSLDHPNIIRCYGSFWHKEIGTFYMVLEFCERGDLSQLIEEQRRRKELLTEREVWRIFIPVMKAVEYLHDKGIIHRDIKALNIFRTANDEIKVGDLGVGRVLGPETVMVETMYGTPLYLSPELCDNRPYNHKTDMWSLGILLYELCALHTPFHGRSLLELSKAICKDEIKPVPSQFSVLISRSIASLLERDQVTEESAE